jgi:hypothetical protein
MTLRSHCKDDVITYKGVTGLNSVGAKFLPVPINLEVEIFS